MNLIFLAAKFLKISALSSVMMKSILNYLNHLGFSDTEAKLYLLLLKSGPLTVAQLAEAAKINRTATYSYISSLLEKGIIAKVKGSSNKIAANPPEHLQYLVEQKITSVMTLKETLPNIITSLNISFPPIKNPPNSKMKYYKGRPGLDTIYKEAFQTKELRVYANLAETVEFLFPKDFNIFEEALARNKKLKIFEIIGDSPEAVTQFNLSGTAKNGRYFYKFMPANIGLTSGTLIYDNKVAILNIKNEISGIVLTNTDYYNNSKQLFDLLWQFLPEPKNL